VNIPLIGKVSWGSNTDGPSGNKFGVQQYAKGTDNAPGGYAMVGEQGPEIMYVPKGSQIKTASETSKLMGNTFNFDGFMNGATFVVREEADIKKVAKEMLDMTRQAARSKGTVMA
jgi:SLT domain-containing protein